jgi:hypothetical protein
VACLRAEVADLKRRIGLAKKALPVFTPRPGVMLSVDAVTRRLTDARDVLDLRRPLKKARTT